MTAALVEPERKVRGVSEDSVVGVDDGDDGLSCGNRRLGLDPSQSRAPWSHRELPNVRSPIANVIIVLRWETVARAGVSAEYQWSKVGCS